MGQPQLECPNYCQETANNPTGAGDFVLNGAVAPYRTFQSALNAGDKIPYEAGDGTDYEAGVGTFQTSPNRIVRDASEVYDSTNGGNLVNFTPGGTVNIISGAPGIWMRNLLGAVQTPGLIRRTGEHTYSEEDLTFANGGFTPIISLSGASNTDITQQFDPVDKSGDTMTGTLAFNGVSRLIQIVTGFPLYFSGNNDGDRWLEASRFGVDDYILYTNEGGAKRRLITADANDDNDAQAVDGKIWDSAGSGTFWSTNVGLTFVDVDTVGLASVSATGMYLRFPMFQLCFGKITFTTKANMGDGNPKEFTVTYPRAFSSAPHAIWLGYSQDGNVGSNNSALMLRADRQAANNTTTLKFYAQRSGNNDQDFDGFYFMAIGPE